MSMSRRIRATPKRCYGKDGSAFIRRNLRRMEPKPRTDSLAARAIRSPGRALGLILGVHTLVWTALPVLLYANLPLDLIEALMYGREWQLGYDKLPPLPWWLVELAYLVTGHDWSYYLLAQIAVCAALAVIYLAARPLVGGAGALVALLIVDGLHYLNYTSAKFNHDVVQLPFWALAGYALHRALRKGQIVDWLLLGIAVGMSLWAKYFVVVLVAPMVVFALIARDARKCLATPGPYVAAAAALVIMAPHLLWLVRNDFLPIAYAEHRAVLSRGWYDHFWHPGQFAVSQLFFLIPSLIIAAPLFIPKRKANEARVAPSANAFDRRIVAWLAFGPIVSGLVMSLVSGRGTVAMWGYPLWLFLGLWLVMTAERALTPARLGRILVTWGIVFACLGLAFIANYDVLPRFDHRYRAVFLAGSALARWVTQGWPDQPRVLVDGKPERAPRIDLADLKIRGAVVVWTDGDLKTLPPEYRADAP